MAQVSQDNRTLTSEVLLEELSALLARANECFLQEPTSQAHQHLQQAGFKRLPQLYRSAYQDLQVLRSLPTLYIPVDRQGVPLTEVDRDAPEYVGGTDNIAGISESQLIAANRPDMGTRKAWYADLIPEIEARLAQRCSWLSHVLECSGDIDTMVKRVAFQVDTVDATRHQSVSSLLGTVEDLKCYMTLLSNHADQQAAFLNTHAMTAQRAIDAKDCAHLQAACKMQALKLKVIEQRLLSFTYTDQTVPALRAVSQHLEAAEQEAVETYQQLATRLKQYEELGPDFVALAERYQQLLEDLRHAEFTLQEFQQQVSLDPAAESPGA